MKDIIYLDTGVLHSFIAQHHDGLPTEISNQRGEEIHDTVENETGYNSQSSIEALLRTGNLEIPLLFKTPEGEIKGIFRPGKFSSEKTVMSQTESGQEIISKQLHDNALEQFEEHLIDKHMLFEVDDEDLEGKYVRCKAEFKIIDFKYLKNIMQSERLTKFMFFEQDDNIKNMEKKLNQSKGNKQEISLARAQLKELKKKYEREKELAVTQFTFIEETLDYLNDILPTDSFIVIGNTLAPLKDEYLREKANELSFKYSGSSDSIQITMIGKVTTIIDEIEMPEFKNDALFDFPKILNYILHPLGLINVNDLIVSPVAIYFEED